MFMSEPNHILDVTWFPWLIWLSVNITDETKTISHGIWKVTRNKTVYLYENMMIIIWGYEYDDILPGLYPYRKMWCAWSKTLYSKDNRRTEVLPMRDKQQQTRDKSATQIMVEDWFSELHKFERRHLNSSLILFVQTIERKQTRTLPVPHARAVFFDAGSCPCKTKPMHNKLFKSRLLKRPWRENCPQSQRPVSPSPSAKNDEGIEKDDEG